MILERELKEAVRGSLARYPVVGLIGCRQVGKTTLAKIIAKACRKRVVYLDIELPSDLSKLQEPELYLSQFTDHLVIIDEIQRMPALFPLIRAMVDKKRVGGRFLILGSASPQLIKHSSESLAGRIIYHELKPFALKEIGYDNLNALWLRGGFPNSYLAKDSNDSFIWRESFIRTYLERDIPQLGIHVPSINLRRFWTMVAHMHDHSGSQTRMESGLGLSGPR